VNLSDSRKKWIFGWVSKISVERHGPAQAASRSLPTVAARAQTRVRSCGICGEHSGTGAGFLRVLRFPNKCIRTMWQSVKCAKGTSMTLLRFEPLQSRLLSLLASVFNYKSPSFYALYFKFVPVIFISLVLVGTCFWHYSTIHMEELRTTIKPSVRIVDASAEIWFETFVHKVPRMI
jgi:hypothetical protein